MSKPTTDLKPKNIINQKNKTSMKNVLKNIAFAALVSAFLISCAEEDVKPRTGGTQDNCQFSNKGCN
jgi:hypothetical protein